MSIAVCCVLLWFQVCFLFDVCCLTVVVWFVMASVCGPLCCVGNGLVCGVCFVFVVGCVLCVVCCVSVL